DGGAALVLGSRHYIRKYMRYLLENGYDVREIDIFRCQKGFRYGNSEKEVTNLCVLLPIHVGGRKIKVLTYVNKGTAPILFGRPIMEKLGLQLNYSEKKMKWPNGEWHDVPLGPKGEYLVNLVEDNSMHRLIHEEIAFETLILEDFMDHVDFLESWVRWKSASRAICARSAMRESGAAPAAGLTAKEFNTRLLIDSAWVDTDNGRRCVVTVMDQATRYVAIRLLKTEQSVDFIKGLERCPCGVPQLAVERKHQVVRRALELFMDEEGGRNETNLVKAAIYVPQQINSLSIHKGTFAQVQKRRLNAQTAFLKADTDARLRCAMNQNFEEVTIGQLVWYWQVSMASHLLKPAAIEQADGGGEWQADPQAALKARSTTQFTDIAQEPGNEIHADIEDQMDDYEPSIIGEDEQMVAPPMSSEIGRLIGEIDEDTSIGQPSSSSRARSTGEGKRRRMGSKTPATDKGTVTISEPPDAAPNTSPTTSTDQVAAVPVPDEVSGELMADETLPDELSFDDVRFVSGDLPTGWTVVEGCLELDEVWLTRAETKRRSDVSERTLTVEQRQQFIEAKVEELNSYFKNAVWTFAEPGAHGTGRVITARWVLTWKRVDEGDDSNPRHVSCCGVFRTQTLLTLRRCCRQTAQHSLDAVAGSIWGVLKGLVTLHVDDMMIGGDRRDRDFSDALERIKKSFDFSKWAILGAKNPMVFCGGRIKVTAQKELTLDYEEFFKKVLPINIVKNRNMDEPLIASEINKARGLIGALQWLQELNKMLRFAKANGQVALRIAKIAPSLEKVCFVCFSDAALSVRSDLTMIVACNEEVLIGKAVPYTLVSWRSFKLPRVCRSSLAAEAQACAMALDELMIVKVFFGMML
ncbi:unnamed protein product, partial [Effrenium voratum]